MPPFTTANAAELLEPGLKEIYLNRFNRWEEEYSGWINVVPTEKNFEEYLTFAGFGLPVEKPEGSPVDFVDPIQGNLKRINHKSFAYGFRITREMWMDDLYGPMRQMTQALAVGTRHLPEVRAARILNNMTSTAAEFLLADGKALAATDHPLLGGGTFANTPSVQADISYTEVQNALIAFETLNDHMNLPVLVRPKTAIVSPTFRFIAEEIFKQESKPNTADRDDNTVSNKGVNLFVSHYLTDADEWAILSDPSVDGVAGHSLVFQWREKPIFEVYEDKDTKDVKVNMYCRLGVGAVEAFGFYGSTGG